MTAQAAHQSVGLVLSGGGAKGIAHIGVIKALEENDIPIDYVVGTSMGAIVGGLYASGYTPEEMLDLILSKDFSYWSTGKIDPALTYYFVKPTETPQLFSLPVARKDSAAAASKVPASVISPIPMSFAFMDLFSAYSAQCKGNFDNLFIPFRCVASDAIKKKAKILSSGSLGDAIRASMSFPIIFQPITIDGDLMYDGGIYDNFPVDVMGKEFAPSVMIGVDVSSPSTDMPTTMMEQIELLVIQNENYDLPEKDGIKLRIHLEEFSLLDFPKAKEISKIGYDKAMGMMDSIKSRITTRTNPVSRNMSRRAFKSKTPFIRFDSVNVSGGSKAQNEYLSYIFAPKNDSDTIGIRQARLSYYQAISSGGIKNFVVGAVQNDSTGLFTLNLKSTFKEKVSVGLGGYITSSNNSYIYLNAGYSTLSFSSVNTNIQAWLGQSYLAGALSGKLFLHSSVPSAFAFEAVVSRRKFYESDRLFFKRGEPAFVISHEYFGKIKWSTAAGRTGRIDLGIGGGQLYNSFFPNTGLSAQYIGRDRIKFNLAQVFASYNSTTLNDINFPTQGQSTDISAAGITGHSFFRHATVLDDVSDVKQSQTWIQAKAKYRNFIPIHPKWTLGIEGEALISSRKLPEDYYAAISSAPYYAPTPASNNSFNAAFRANSYIAAGITPIYRFNDNLSARITAHAFLPMRKIVETENHNATYGRWFNSCQFFAEADIVYQFPFATLAAYCNYATYRNDINIGISFGIYLPAPSFL